MLRLLIELLFMILVFTLLKRVIQVVMRGFLDGMGPRNSSPPPRAAPQPHETVPLTGELKKDPVCGTYTSAATSLQTTVRGETFYFCSPECREKFAIRVHS